MKLHGLQKMTLLDFPGHVACRVFLGGCDFRCPFCHNYELADGTAKPVMEEEEFFAFLEKRNGLLDGVAITGGEPCLHKELPAFLQKIKSRGFLTKLDTNGTHPQLLRQILEEGLADYVAMDIKNSPARYAETIGIPGFSTDRIDESIRILLDGTVPYEFRTTVVRQFHDEDSFRAIGPWIQGAERYYLQKFTDRESVPFAGLNAAEDAEMDIFADITRPYVNNVEVRGVG